MVFTLHRYIFIDLLKKFLLGVVVLSLLMGLGMMIKPLRSYNIDPMKVPTLIAYTMPITVTMVMPIAALLATTLTYGRLAFDNEINACRSSGISVISLIYPAGTLALLIGLASLLLGFHTIPYFVSRFENILSEDAEAMIFRGIDKGEMSGLFSGMVIHADRVMPKDNILEGVTLVSTDKEIIKRVITAKAVKLTIEKHPDTGGNMVNMQLAGAIGLIGDAYVDIGRNEFSIPIPTLLKDKIKFKNLDELKAISTNLGSFSPIRRAFENVFDQYMQESLYNYADIELRKSGYVFLECDNGRNVRIFASGCSYIAKSGVTNNSSGLSAELLPLDDGTIIVEYSDPDNLALRKVYTCDQAGLQYSYNDKAPRVVLSMKNAVWQTSGGNVVSHLSEVITGIIIPDNVQRQAKALRVNDFVADDIDIIMPGYASERLFFLGKRLKGLCRELLVEIIAEKHSRLAFGVSCVILTIMGAGLGIIFKSGHLLTAFGISFIPAVFCLVTMFTGKHIAESSASVSGGLLFMWSGVIFVAILDVLMYRKLSKT